MLTTNHLRRFRAARVVGLKKSAVRKLIKHLSKSLDGAAFLLVKPSIDSEVSFHLWETTLPSLKEWTGWVVVRHSQEYSSAEAFRWSRLLASYDGLASVRVGLCDAQTRSVLDAKLQLVLTHDDRNSRFGLEYSFKGEWDNQPAADLARCVFTAWQLPQDVASLVNVDVDGRRGFRAVVGDQIKRYERPWDEYPERHFPAKLRVDWFESVEDACRSWVASAACLPAESLELLFQAKLNRFKYSLLLPTLQQWSGRWNYWLFGSYREDFDTLSRPTDFSAGLPYRYPLLSIGHDDLQLQIDIVHTPVESFLEFQSAGGVELLSEYLQSIHDQARVFLGLSLKFEHWTGLFAERCQEHPTDDRA